MITKFKITRLPVRATVEINATVIEQDYEYPISDQSNMTIQVNDRGVPHDDFGFRLGNEDNVWSPEYKCTVNANVAVGAFNITNDIIPVKLNEVTVYVITFEDQVDRLKFVSHNPKYGSLKINGSTVLNGKTYLRHEIQNVEFVSNGDVTEQNVESVVTYYKGNVDGLSTACTFVFKSTANLAAQIDIEIDNAGILTTV